MCLNYLRKFMMPTLETWIKTPTENFTNNNSLQISHTIIDSGLDSGKEGNVLFNDALNTFYLRLYGVRHMVKYLTDSERGNRLSPHGLVFPINSKGSFICTIPQTG